MFDDPGASFSIDIDDGEGRIADPANLADRKGIHNRFSALANISEALGIFQRHGRGEIGQDRGLHSAAQAVGKDGDEPAFFLDAAREKYVARSRLSMFGLLAVANVDNAVASLLRREEIWEAR